MEVTKWLKPSVWLVTYRGRRECAGRNASERRASLEKVDVQADPTAISGKADTLGEMSEDDAQSLHRGTGGSTYTRKARATREAPKRGQGCTFGRMFSARTGQARIGYRPSKKSIQRVVEKVHALTDRSGTWQETTTLVSKVNRTLRGW